MYAVIHYFIKVHQSFSREQKIKPSVSILCHITFNDLQKVSSTDVVFCIALVL